jgi:tetratricopeptide (TPR) repeat protein
MKLKSIIILLIYIAISILLCNIPLFNYLGYESSFVIGVISSLLSGIWTISYLRKKFFYEDSTIDHFKEYLKKSYIINLLLLIIPFVILSINAFFVRNCSFVNGIFFYLLLPVVSVIFSVALAAFIFSLFKRKIISFYVLTLVLVILSSVCVYYFYPQSFIYNSIFGYFSPMIYDEEMSISVWLILYRVSGILEAILLLFAGLTIIKRSKKEDGFFIRFSYLKNLLTDSKSVILLLIVIVIYWFFQNEARIILNDGFIQSKLGGKYETEHFNIYYSPETYNDEAIKRIAGFHEFYYEQISNQLKISLSKKMESYIYPSPDVKNDLIGAKNTDIAKPWLRQTHINSRDLEAALKHELVHVMAGEFGLPVIDAGIQSGTIEGTAMAVEWDFGNRTLHQFSAQMLKMNMNIDMDNLLSTTGFISQNPSYSYVLCGSFFRFLIDRYGVENFKRVYAWSNFEGVYQKKLSDLNIEWKDFLRTIRTGETDSSIVIYFFKRPSIFQKVCARVIANINRSGWNELNNKNYDKAIQYFHESLELSNGNDARRGLIVSYFQSGDYDSVITMTNNIFRKTSHVDMFLPLRLHRGDAFWQKSIKKNNKCFIDSALIEYKTISKANFDDDYTFAAECRINILSDSNIHRMMGDYYFYRKDDFIKALIVKDILEKYPEFYVGGIILARTLSARDEHNLSIEYLNSIPDTNLTEYFKFEKHRLLGMNYFYTRKYQDAKENFLLAITSQSNESTCNKLSEWIEKCEFFERKGY